MSTCTIILRFAKKPTVYLNTFILLNRMGMRFKSQKASQVLSCMSVIPTSRKLRQKDQEFEASLGLGYIASDEREGKERRERGRKDRQRWERTNYEKQSFTFLIIFVIINISHPQQFLHFFTHMGPSKSFAENFYFIFSTSFYTLKKSYRYFKFHLNIVYSLNLAIPHRAFDSIQILAYFFVSFLNSFTEMK